MTKDTLLLLKKCFSENINVLLNTKQSNLLPFIAVKGSCYTQHTGSSTISGEWSANLVMASYLQQECRVQARSVNYLLVRYLLLPQF